MASDSRDAVGASDPDRGPRRWRLVLAPDAFTAVVGGLALALPGNGLATIVVGSELEDLGVLMLLVTVGIGCGLVGHGLYTRAGDSLLAGLIMAPSPMANSLLLAILHPGDDGAALLGLAFMVLGAAALMWVAGRVRRARQRG